MPAIEVGERIAVGEALAKLLEHAPLDVEAQELEPGFGEERLDRRKREAMLPTVEQQVPALAGGEEVAALGREAPAADEVERARTRIIQGMDRSFANSQQLAMQLSDVIADGDWRLLFTNYEEIKRVTPADVRDGDALKGAVAALEREVGPTDVLLPCAGVGRLSTANDLDLDGLRTMLEVNVLGVARTIEAVLPGMFARGRGHIVGVASVAFPFLPRQLSLAAATCFANSACTLSALSRWPWTLGNNAVAPFRGDSRSHALRAL